MLYLKLVIARGPRRIMIYMKYGIGILIKMGDYVWVGASSRCFHRFSVTESQCD